MRTSPEEDHLPPKAVFAFLAETFADVARRIERLEAHAAGAILGAAAGDATRVMAFQELDLIRQMAEDAGRVAEVARRENGARHQDLAAALRLAALRDSLVSTAASRDAVASDGSPETRGRVELFDAEGAGEDR